MRLSYSLEINWHYLVSRFWMVFCCSMVVGGREIQSEVERKALHHAEGKHGLRVRQTNQ